MAWVDLQDLVNTASLSVFGEPVNLDGATVQADFHEPDEEVRAGDGSAIARVPRIIVKSSDVPGSPVGRPVTARLSNYAIADARHDGRGFCMLELELL